MKKRQRFFATFYHQYKMWKVNWIDFTFIHIGCEYSMYKSTCELTFGLFGVNVCFEYYY